jgi:ankyrin repeat protein
MNPEDLAELLVSKRKIDLIRRPGNDLSKMLSINYQPDPNGQLFFTCWDPSLNIDFCLPNTKTELNKDNVREIFQQLLDNFYVIEKDSPKMLRGGKSEPLSLSKGNVEKVGKKLTQAQIKKLNEYLPEAIKGVKIEKDKAIFLVADEKFKITKPNTTEKTTAKDVKHMLELGANPNYEFSPSSYDPIAKKIVKKPKRSVLQYALEQEKLDIAKILITHGANVNYTFGESSLLFRIKNEKAVELLISHGAKPSKKEIKQISDIIPLAIKGAKIMAPIYIEKPKFSDFKKLMGYGIDANHEFSPTSYDPDKKKTIKKPKRSLLQFALEQENYPVAEYLIKHGANVNYAFGESSLLFRTKSEKAKELLISHGAKPSKKEIKQITDIIPLAIKGVKIMAPMYIEKPKFTDFKKLMEYGTDVNHEFTPTSYDPDKKKTIKKPKRSLLQFALEQENYPVAEYLIKHGANVNYVFIDTKGESRSLLHRMTNLKNMKAVEILLNHGADVNSKIYPNEMTVLHLILLPINNQSENDVKQNILFAKLFLKHKADVSLTNKIQLKDGPVIESSVVQSAQFLVKKVEGKFQSQKLTDLIEKAN